MSEFKEGRSIEDVCSALVDGGDVSRLVSFAKACEVAERYEDMVAAVKCMANALCKESMTGPFPCSLCRKHVVEAVWACMAP